MRERALVSENCQTALPIPELRANIEEWLADCEYRNHSPRTVEVRQLFTRNLLWWLDHVGHEECGTTQLKQFFLYLRNSYEEQGGRWGNPKLTKPLTSTSIKN
jgi:hypothetical protein